MQHCFRVSPCCRGICIGLLLLSQASPFLISNQIRPFWWVLDQEWHIMYFTWWNHSLTSAWNSLFAWSDLPGWCMQQWFKLNSHLERQSFFRGQPSIWDAVDDRLDDGKIYLPDGDTVRDVFQLQGRPQTQQLNVCSSEQIGFFLVFAKCELQTKPRRAAAWSSARP